MRPQRVISLVPSLTESLFDLGLGDCVVGITDYCIYPAEKLVGLPRLGGPKNPRLVEILALKPDLVLANQEENTRQIIQELQKAGLPVWLSFPRTVRQSLDMLWQLITRFEAPQSSRVLEELENLLKQARLKAAERPQRRYFCPIWYDQTQAEQPWWMTFNDQTYCHDLLEILGGVNVFAQRQRRYPLAADLGRAAAEPPGERDTRYPRLLPEEVRLADPEVILLPDEPFPFDETYQAVAIEQFQGTRAVERGAIYTLDGSLVTWHGTRLHKALQLLAPIFEK